jgi:hypothetical protein
MGLQEHCPANAGQSERTDKMWETIKKNFARGFGLSLGGAIGWRLGNFAADMFGRLWKWFLISCVGVAAATGIPEYAHNHIEQQQQSQVKAHR